MTGRRKVWAGLLGLAMLLLPLQAAAQSCPHHGLIVETAQSILRDRADLNRFRQRQYGAEAAYLLIRYDALSAAQTVALLDDLVAARVRDAAALRMAWRIAHHGPAQLATGGAPDATLWLNPHALHALIHHDDGQTFLDWIAAAQRNPEADPDRLAPYAQGFGILAAAADLEDVARQRFARHAEDAGARRIAALLLGDLADLAALRAFLDRQAERRWVENAFPSDLWLLGVGLRAQDVPPILPGAPKNSETEALFQVAKAAHLDGLSGWLAIYLNQTGRVANARQAARAFLDAYAAGRIDPARDPEAGWLIIYRSLAETGGAAALRDVLAGFDMPAPSQRHFAKTGNVTFDWILAKRALRPFLSGQTDQPPPKPPLLGTTFDWTVWVEIAQTLRADPDAALPVHHRAIAAELLAETGAWHAALASTDGLAAEEALRIKRDFVKRLDRLCLGATFGPGQATLMGGMTLFRFP